VLSEKSRPMKVIFVSDHYSTPEQPGILRTWQVAKHLAEQGDEVVVIAPAQHYLFQDTVSASTRPHRIAGVRVIRMRTLALRRGRPLSRVTQYALQLVLSAVHTWRAGRADVVVAGLTPSMLGIGAYAVARLRGVPFILDERDLALDAAQQAGLLPPPLIRMAQRVERFLNARAAKIITVTPGLHRLLIERGVPQEKLVLAPNGYEGAAADLPAVDRAALRERLGWGTSTVLLYAGGLGPMYDLDVVLDALGHFDHDQFLFVIMGEGDRKAHYAERSRREGLPVRFDPAVSKAELELVCRAADVCIVPLRNIDRSQLVLSNKLFDYLGAGRPVLVTAPGDMAALVAEAGAGLAFPPEDPVALAKALQTLIADPPAADRMGAAGRAFVLRSWTRASSVRRFRSALAEARAEVASGPAQAPSEPERIRAVYGYYDSSDREQRKRDGANPGNRMNAATRWAAIQASLDRLSLPPDVRVLDVGCGTGSDLTRIAAEFRSLHPRLSGIDLLADRIERARTAVPDAVLSVGGADGLPYADGQFDVVLASTVFSSIPEQAIARSLAREIARVVSSGGTVLCYDVRYPNPGNPYTRAVRRRDLRRLFPGADMRVSAITLLPPLARRLGPLARLWYPALYVLPFLRSHYLAEIQVQRPAASGPGRPGISALAVVPVNCRFEQMAVNQRLRALSDVAALDIIASYPDSFPPDISATARIASFTASARATSAMVKTPLFAVQVTLWVLAQRVLRRPRYDIVYTFQDVSAVAGWLLGSQAERWVIDVLDDPGQSAGNARQRRQRAKAWLLRGYEAAISFLLRRASTVITIGLDHADPLPQLLTCGYQVSPGRIVPLRQSVDIRRIQDVVRVPPTVPRPDWPVLTFVGYVSKLRGVDVFLQAAVILQERGRFLEVALVGHLNQQDGQWLAAAQARQPSIRYHGVLPSHDALRRMSATTIGVLPFPDLRETAPVQAVTGVEYLALGKPIVATDLPGARALVDHQVNGILVPPGDPTAMADAIEVILGTPGLSEQMGRAALKKAESFDSIRIREEVAHVLCN
jgi:colanic acid biosynthesis glycosyl transferase WcaI